jgi:hypothetical protein
MPVQCVSGTAMHGDRRLDATHQIYKVPIGLLHCKRAQLNQSKPFWQSTHVWLTSCRGSMPALLSVADRSPAVPAAACMIVRICMTMPWPLSIAKSAHSSAAHTAHNLLQLLPADDASGLRRPLLPLLLLSSLLVVMFQPQLAMCQRDKQPRVCH